VIRDHGRLAEVAEGRAAERRAAREVGNEVDADFEAEAG
jgi:hypothetical protein